MRNNYTFDIADRELAQAHKLSNAHIATSAHVGEERGHIVCRFFDAVPAMHIRISSADVNRDIKIIGAIFAVELGMSRSASRQSRMTVATNIRHFYNFADALCEQLNVSFPTMNDLPQNTPSLYEQWLLQPRFQSDRKSLLSDKSRLAYFREFLNFIAWCREPSRSFLTTKWHEKSNPWKSSYHSQKKDRDAPSQNLIEDIRQACLKSIKETEQDLLEGDEIIKNFDISNVDLSSPKSFKDYRVAVKVSALSWSETHDIDSTPFKSNTILNEAIYSRYVSRGDIRRRLVITSKQLVPYALILAMDTLFNTSTLVGLKWSDIRRDDPIFGSTRLTIRGVKARAKTSPRRTFDATLDGVDHPAGILKLLRAHAARVETWVPRELRNDVFVYYSTQRSRHLSLSIGAGEASQTWGAALAAFCQEDGLGRFTVQDLRVAGGEAVYKLTGGDIKAQQIALNHHSSDMSYRHYHWRAARAFGQERLADIMARQERLIASRGKVDDRDGRLIEGGGTAATPGFTCLEPTRSPIPGQREGAMCNAYGLCPTCRNGAVNLNDPLSLAKLRLLRDEINKARTKISPARWMSEWRHQLAALEQVWLPAFDEAVAAEAELRSPLPIPTIE